MARRWETMETVLYCYHCSDSSRLSRSPHYYPADSGYKATERSSPQDEMACDVSGRRPADLVDAGRADSDGNEDWAGEGAAVKAGSSLLPPQVQAAQCLVSHFERLYNNIDCILLLFRYLGCTNTIAATYAIWPCDFGGLPKKTVPCNSLRRSHSPQAVGYSAIRTDS